MRPIRMIIRIFGWLLTPLVAWAASHFGGGIGATIASGIPDPRIGLGLTIIAAALSGLLGLYLWIALLRRSPELRRALHVGEDATPETEQMSDE